MSSDHLAVRAFRGRFWWTTTGFVLAALIILALALSSISNIAYLGIPSSQRIFVQSLSAVSIHLDSGSVTIERTHSHDTVVENSGSRGLAEPTDEERVIGHTLSIRSSCHPNIFNYCNRNYVLRIPNSVTITVVTGGGNVSVTGIDSSVSLDTSQGDVIVVGAKGSVRVSTGQGDVTLRRIEAPSVDAYSGQGDVTVDFSSPPSSATATSGQGNIIVGLPKGPDSYHVHATSAQGTVADDVNESPTSARVIHALSGQGDVTVRYDAK
jgi:hypothetical protein